MVLVDDNRACHADTGKRLPIFAASASETDEMEALLFGGRRDGARKVPRKPSIQLESRSAYPDEKRITQVRRAVSAGPPPLGPPPEKRPPQSPSSLLRRAFIPDVL